MALKNHLSLIALVGVDGSSDSAVRSDADEYCERVQPSPDATRLVRHWARSALRSEIGAPSGIVSLDGLSVEEVLAAIQRQRVGDLLAMNGEALELPAEILDPLTAQRDRDRRALMVNVLELGRLANLFGSAGVPWLSIKGPALAVQTTGDLTARGSGDIDVFVAPSSVEVAFHALAVSGWTVRPVGSGEPDSWAWKHILAMFNEMTFDGPGSTIDLHWRLDPTHSALPDFDASWSRRAEVVIGDLPVQTLEVRDAFSHAGHHAMKDDWRWLRSLVDIHRLARRPEVWTGDPLGRVELAALAVVDACIGLPDDLPAEVRDGLAAGRRAPQRVPRRAMAAQERPVVAAFPFPAAQSFRDARYRFRAGHSAADAGRTVVSVVLPAKAVADLPDVSARTAVPRVLSRRVAWLVRRTVAWVRREPGAAVIQRRYGRR